MLKRTDRILVILALLLLLVTGSLFVFYDDIFQSLDRSAIEKGAIAEVVSGTGDTRVRYKDELHWQRARAKQRLVFDDSVFAGPNSEVRLKVGRSDLHLDANTLIVLRKKNLFSALNLNYGGLQGLLTPGDRLMIQSGQEHLELSSTQASKLRIRKSGTRLNVAVTEGRARVVFQGKVRELTPKDNLVIDERERQDALQITAPRRRYVYADAKTKEIQVAWAYESRRAIVPTDVFTLERAEDREAFKAVGPMQRGQMGTSMIVKVPSRNYYRVRDGHGRVSETESLYVAQLRPPELLSPRAAAEFEAEDGGVARVHLKTPPLPPESQLEYQIARDREFTQTVENNTISVEEAEVALPPQEYWVRARSRSAADGLSSAWTAPVPFSVRDHFDVQRLAGVVLPEEIIIPNEAYPSALYASDARAQAFLQQQLAAFRQLFSGLLVQGYTLKVSRRGHASDERVQSTPEFPQEWIYPQAMELRYRFLAGSVEKLETRGHRLNIRMEPPNRLSAAPSGELQWSPLLFARGYEVQVARGRARVKSFTTTTASGAISDLPSGAYSYRVRALGLKRKPISDWSDPHAFGINPPENVLAQQEATPEPARHPAEAAALSTKVDAPARSRWERDLGAWFWAGSGINFVLVRQSISSTADIEYKNTKAPSGFFEAGWLGRTLGAVFSYKRTPGDVRVDNYPINKRDFIWSTYSGEALWRSAYTGPKNLPLIFGLRAGMQSHNFPFLYVASDRSLVQGSNNLTTASAGFFAETLGRVRYYWSMRYQQPLQASSAGGNNVQIHPITAFDGSIGTSYLLNDHWKTGLFWYGQLHNYKFDYTSATGVNAGTQWLFYTNAEFRLGYDF